MKTALKLIMLRAAKCNVKNKGLILLFFAILLAGCSSKPSENDGRQAIENKIRNEAEGHINLVQFQKTDGQLAEVMGVKVYTLDYDAQIEFAEACKWNIKLLAGQLVDDSLTFRTSKLPDKNLNATAQFAEAALNQGQEMSKGEKVQLAGSIRFEQKERGWAVDNIKVGSVTPVSNLPKTVSGSATPAENSTKPETHASGVTVPPDVLRKVEDDLIKIANAKLTWAAQNGKKGEDVPSEIDLEPYFIDNKSPIHPSGGRYLIKSVNEAPVSSIYGATEAETILKVFKDLDAITKAKFQWFITQTGRWQNYIPSEEDLKRYFGNHEFPKHPAGGNYIINAAGKSAESSKYGTPKALFQRIASACGISNQPDQNRPSADQLIAAAKTQIKSFCVAIDMFQVDNGFYPDSGLMDLVQRPRNGTNWHGPYLSHIPKDPWGNDYVYNYPGSHNAYDVICVGPDGRLGSPDDFGTQTQDPHQQSDGTSGK